MTVQRSFYSLGEIAWEILYPHLPFQLHEITPVACEEINTKIAWADNLL